MSKSRWSAVRGRFRVGWPALAALASILAIVVAVIFPPDPVRWSVTSVFHLFAFLLLAHGATVFNWAVRVRPRLLAVIGALYGILFCAAGALGTSITACGYPTKARQTEAKRGLALVYDLQKNWQSESARLASLEEISFEPIGRFYAYVLIDCFSFERGRLLEPANWITRDAKKEIYEYAASLDPARECGGRRRGYLAYAMGKIATRKDAQLDVWRLAEDKSLRNIQVGL